MLVTYDQLLDIATEAGLHEESVRTDYSGRAMYGKTCVGFDLESGRGELLSLGAALQTEGLLEEFLGKARFDSMGMGIIVYFPGITCEDGPDSDYEEEEEEL